MMRAMLRAFSWGAAAASLVAILGCAGGEQRPPEPNRAGATMPKQLQDRQVIVTLADDTPERWARITAALSADYQLQEAGNFPLTSIRVQCVVFRIPEDRSLPELLNQLRGDPRVESAQVNQVFEGLKAMHTDPYAGLVYGAAAIRADQAHRISTGKGVKVAVVDTGVDKEHPDLRGRVAKTQNFVEGGATSFLRDRHGTAVAGIISARADDGIGIYGVAPEAEVTVAKACWYPDAKSAKALCSSWTLAKGIDYAIVSGAQVLNMSLAGPPDTLLARLLTRANERGMTVVAAAAEDSTDPGFPASMEFVICVVASDAKGRVQAEAWTKSTVLVAPGVDILTTAPRGAYDYLSGSSLAAAHVSGVVALLLQQNPHLSPADVLNLLKTTARPSMPKTPGSGSAPEIVDACGALGKLMGRSACP